MTMTNTDNKNTNIDMYKPATDARKSIFRLQSKYHYYENGNCILVQSTA